jgi:hypothetical protein
MISLRLIRQWVTPCEAGGALTDIARTFGVSHTTIGRLRYAQIRDGA